MSIFSFRHVAATTLILVLLGGSVLSVAQPRGDRAQPGRVFLTVHLDQADGDMYPMWAYWGYDEPNVTYMADGRQLIREIDQLSSGPVYYRTHNLLNTDEGRRFALKWGSTNAYTEDEQGNPRYDWTIVDKIVDTMVENGGRPMMEVAFMPKPLSSAPDSVPYRHHWQPGDPYGEIFTGWAYPPNDYQKWAELVYRWVRHSVERYGAEEVSTWYWDVWNEPDIPYWHGTREEYFKLYDYTADAIKRALPSARVGGPTTTNPEIGEETGAFLREFLEHCRSGTNYATGETGAPLDYISFHAKGDPDVVGDGSHVQMDMGQQLRFISDGFQIVSEFEEYRDLPIILGETDPEGCAACSVQSGYRENAYRNGTMYSSYTAASFARMYELADQHDVNFEGAVSWSFVFEDQPWFDGFRSMATNGVAKPVFNVFRMFGMMRGDRVEVDVSQIESYDAQQIIEQGVRAQPDINALASSGVQSAEVMLWNYHDDDVPAPDTPVTVDVEGIPADEVKVHHYRIDKTHSNAYTTWREMGGPQQVTRSQYNRLVDAGQLKLLDSPKWVTVSEEGTARLQFELPRQGVSLVAMSW